MTDLKWTTQRRKVKDLIPYHNNPRKMSEKQVADLRTSFEKFDLVEIPAITLSNVLLAGHQRMRIMLLLGRGEEEIDVRVPNRLLTEAEAKEYLLRSNKNTGSWDWDLLAQEDENILLDVGFTVEELREFIMGTSDKLPDIDADNEEKLEQVTLVLTREQKIVYDSVIKSGQLRLFEGDKNIKDGTVVVTIMQQWAQSQ